jgi:hypothetical protein
MALVAATALTLIWNAGQAAGKPGADAASKFAAETSGFEGREEALGRALSTVIKTLNNTQPYQHEMNDALVKALLSQMQFAKDRDLMPELIEHDRRVLLPLLVRTKKYIDQTGNTELALVAMFERTACHYQLVDETHAEPGLRSYTSPYKTVLDATRRLEQFDMTEEWIHNNWTIPRFLGMAKVMGVNITVSPWNEEGRVAVQLADRVARN